MVAAASRWPARTMRCGSRSTSCFQSLPLDRVDRIAVEHVKLSRRGAAGSATFCCEASVMNATFKIPCEAGASGPTISRLSPGRRLNSIGVGWRIETGSPSHT